MLSLQFAWPTTESNIFVNTNVHCSRLSESCRVQVTCTRRELDRSNQYQNAIYILFLDSACIYISEMQQQWFQAHH